MRSNFVCLLLLICISIIACERIDNRLIIKNESMESIVMITSEDSIIKSFAKVDYYYLNTIKPHAETANNCGLDNWDAYVYRSYNKKLNLYFFDVDTLKKYNDMNKIIENKLWVKQISLDKETLDKNKWIVVFN